MDLVELQTWMQVRVRAGQAGQQVTNMLVLVGCVTGIA